MCGIFGYIGKNRENAVARTIDGLKKLEYRGYDSAGFATVHEGKLVYCKEVGKVSFLEKEMRAQEFKSSIAIAQTRWATHGVPSRINAHPHLNESQTLAVVHNGIIENYDILRKNLQAQGVVFRSETDTEVVAHLVSSFYKGDFLAAVKEAVALLKGSYALAFIHQDFPEQIIAVGNECPLAVGRGEGESFLSSDPHAFAETTQDVLYLANKEIAVIFSDHIELYGGDFAKKTADWQRLDISVEDISKGKFEHYTLKEIYEQPQTIRQAMLGRLDEEYGTAVFDELTLDVNELQSAQRIIILACGTSYHAGCIAGYMLEEMARIPVQVEISSEFRYKNPVVPQNTLALVISQSGETADTLAAMRELKAKGVKVIAICNVQGSTISREADSTLFLRAGPEIGVCSTKAFSSQVVVLALFTLMLARMRHLSKELGQEFLSALIQLPEQVKRVLAITPHIQELAKKYAGYQNFFFIGRQYMYPTSLEGALKLKEISYINANGYAAGEMKHGPIALISPDCPTVAMCGNYRTFDKLISNLMEIKARSGLVIAIAEESSDLQGIPDDIIMIPETIDQLAAIPSSVAAQLLSYYIAKERGADIDQPRNLAKSVTVE